MSINKIENSEVFRVNIRNKIDEILKNEKQYILKKYIPKLKKKTNKKFLKNK